MAINTENSRALDLHRWSESPEIRLLTSTLLDELFPRFPNALTKTLREKALRVILLDLYCCWQENPDKSLGIALNKKSYIKGYRYNKLRLRYDPVRACFNALLSNNFIEALTGNQSAQRVTRMISTEKLRDLFIHAAWNIEIASLKLPDEIIIAKPKEDAVAVDYAETARSRRMRAELEQFNSFITSFTFKIASNGVGFINAPGLPSRLISMHRSFLNKQLNEGGRFYGGYQNIDKRYRPYITIDGSETVEIDFKALHPTLAYAKAGVDFYPETGLDDLYMTQDFGYDLDTHKRYRSYLKELFLMMMNAPSEVSAVKAMRKKLHSNYEDQRYANPEDIKVLYPLGITYQLVRRTIDWVKGQHPSITPLLFQNLGRKFMFIDSEITSRVLNKMMGEEKPVLPVHDSYICKREDQDLLKRFMHEAFQEEMIHQRWAPITIKTKTTDLLIRNEG